jgi:Fe(3+) dicitrate transport protein
MVELDALTVQGDWIGVSTEEEIKVYPGSRSLLEREALQESGALNLEDALRSVPSIQILDETGTGILPNIGDIPGRGRDLVNNLTRAGSGSCCSHCGQA